MICTRDFATRENHWQITSLVTKKLLFTITYALFFIYIQHYCLDVIEEITSIFHSSQLNYATNARNQTLSCVTTGSEWYTLHANHYLHFSEIQWFIHAHFLVYIIDLGRSFLHSSVQIVWSLVTELGNLRPVTYCSYVHDANKPLLFLSLYHVDHSPFFKVVNDISRHVSVFSTVSYYVFYRLYRATGVATILTIPLYT